MSSRVAVDGKGSHNPTFGTQSSRHAQSSLERSFTLFRMTVQKIIAHCLAAMFRFNARMTKSSAAVRAAPGRNSTGTSLMRSWLQILIVAGAFSLLATTVRGASEIVIAIRYLQATGT